MELKECINLRHSSRSYFKKKVNKKDILEIIECARLAPSAANRQNWYFIVLQDNAKNNIALLMEGYLKKINKIIRSKEHATLEYNPSLSVLKSIDVIKQASVLILVFRCDDKTWFEGDYLSIGCAVEHMVLKATDLGLGSLWLRDVIYLRQEITNLFDLKDMELVTGLAIGYPKEEKYLAKKKNIEEIMRWEYE